MVPVVGHAVVQGDVVQLQLAQQAFVFQNPPDPEVIAQQVADGTLPTHATKSAVTKREVAQQIGNIQRSLTLRRDQWTDAAQDRLLRWLMAAKRARQGYHPGPALPALPPPPMQFLGLPAPVPDEGGQEDGDDAEEQEEDEGSSTSNSNTDSSSESADECNDSAAADEPASEEPRTLEEARAKLTEVYDELGATQEAFCEQEAENIKLREEIAALKERVAQLEALPAGTS